MILFLFIIPLVFTFIAIFLDFKYDKKSKSYLLYNYDLVAILIVLSLIPIFNYVMVATLYVALYNLYFKK